MIVRSVLAQKRADNVRGSESRILKGQKKSVGQTIRYWKCGKSEEIRKLDTAKADKVRRSESRSSVFLIGLVSISMCIPKWKGFNVVCISIGG